MKIIIEDNKKIILKATLYIIKSGNKTERKINLYFNGAEFTKNFYNKNQCKEFINFLKYYNIPINLIKSNYNCSYMDLAF